MTLKTSSYIQRFLPHKWYNTLFICIYLILGISALVRLFADMKDGWHYGAYQDFLYNYGSGFIRRGLTGEIIILFKQYLHIPPLVTICVSSLAAYVLLSYILLRYFHRKHYSPIVLVIGFVLGSAVIYQFYVMRRDYIELALLAITLLAFNRFTTGKWIIIGNILMMFAIALHEATFFFSIPILIVISNAMYKKKLKSVLYWLPSISMFLACCYFKGNQYMYDGIIERVTAYIPDAFSNEDNLRLLSFIKTDAIDAFRFHVGVNFFYRSYWMGVPIPAFILTFVYYLFIPYITVATLIAFTPSQIKRIDICNLIGVILFQFICLLPMWTILSCDIARVAVYWIISSLLVWAIVPEYLCDEMLLSPLNRSAGFIFSHFFSHIPNKPTLTIIILFVGIVEVHRSIHGTYTYSYFHHLFQVFSSVYQVIINHFPI